MKLITATMNQLIDPRRAVDELSVGDQESDYDDDDRRELISHYATDKYLSKWEEAEEDEDDEEEKPDNKLPREDLEVKETDNRKIVHHLVATLDCDDMSLVSYNSVRDCQPSATLKTAVSEPAPCQLGVLPQSTGEEMKLWQGYGGNIYFDAVRCQSMRINSSKSGKSRKEAISKRWKSKSCTPLNRQDQHQSHQAGIYTLPKESPQASMYNLGSLRMRSVCKDKKCKAANCRHSESARLPGKICKGFSEKLITETFQRLQENNAGSRLTKETLTVSGGQVRDLLFDPIDKVRQFNTQCKGGKDFTLNFEHGFPALLSDSSFFSHDDHRSSTVVTGDTGPFIKLPVLGKMETKHKTSKDGIVGENSKQTNEPKQVFIIPFGAFDDPVEVESDSKRKADKREKSVKNAGEEMKPSIKDVSKPSEELENNTQIENGVESHTVDVYSQRDSGRSVKHPTTPEMAGIENSSFSPGSARNNLPDFHLKREISNLSLSNYLRAVPTHGSKVQKSPSSPRSSAMVPKMSYTNRSRALPTFYMVNNSLHQVHQSGLNSQKLNNSHVYGGYYPTTDRKESKLFYAEISTMSEQGQATGDEELARAMKNSNTKRGNSNEQISKHTLVKAGYMSRKSFSRQNSERSPRVNGTLRKSEKNLLHVPVTGHQFSRFHGIHNR